MLSLILYILVISMDENRVNERTRTAIYETLLPLSRGEVVDWSGF